MAGRWFDALCCALLLAAAAFLTAATISTAAAAAPVATSASATAGNCPPPPPQPTAAQLHAAPRDRGLLWRVSRDGRSSYLFGTLHVGKPAWRRFGPQLTAALAASDVLALEIDPSDPELADALRQGQPSPPLPDALKARLEKAFAQACLAPDALAALHPLLQATMLTVLEARWVGMDPADALENLLAARARVQGKRVLSLETAAQQKAALLPDDADAALQMLQQSLDQLEDRSGRRALARLARVWEQGDLATLENHDAWCECAATDADRAFMRRLNDDRNPALADGIEAQHRQGRRVFAAVGALHMTGPQSLPRLLAQRGFKVQRMLAAPGAPPAPPSTRPFIGNTLRPAPMGRLD